MLQRKSFIQGILGVVSRQKFQHHDHIVGDQDHRAQYQDQCLKTKTEYPRLFILIQYETYLISIPVEHHNKLNTGLKDNHCTEHLVSWQLSNSKPFNVYFVYAIIF